jgi:hypothetical protein
LHDVADVRMKRRDPDHERASLGLARELMKEFHFSDNDVAIVVDDAIALHSCHDGKVAATLGALGGEMPLEETKAWIRKKATRDFRDKIQFEDVREGARRDYECVMELFSR